MIDVEENRRRKAAFVFPASMYTHAQKKNKRRKRKQAARERSPMSQKAEYRNAVRSRKMIRDAFIELLRTKPLDKITVTGIVEKAGLNRGTFYAHYADINMLIQSMEDEIVQSLYALLASTKIPYLLKEPLPFFLKISEYFEQNKELILALMSSQPTNLFIKELPDLIARHLASSEDISEDMRARASFMERCYFYAGGAGSLYLAWFRGTVSGNLRDVAYRLSEIIRRGY